MCPIDNVLLSGDRVLESLLKSESNQVLKNSYFAPAPAPAPTAAPVSSFSPPQQPNSKCLSAAHQQPPQHQPQQDSQQQQQQQHQTSQCSQSQSHRHIFHTSFTPDDRRILGEWMLDVCMVEHCQNDVFPLSMVILDIYLSKEQIKRKLLQLLGSVCLILASKVRQTNQISFKRMKCYTDNQFSTRDLQHWEMSVLAALRWDLALVSPIDYVDILIRRPKQIQVIVQNYHDSLNNEAAEGISTSTTVDTTTTTTTNQSSSIASCMINNATINNFNYRHNSHINQLIELETQRLIYKCSLDYSYSLYPPSMVACACLTRAMQSVLSSSAKQQSQKQLQPQPPYKLHHHHQQQQQQQTIIQQTDNLYTFDHSNNNDQQSTKINIVAKHDTEQQHSDQYFWDELFDETSDTTINMSHTYLTGITSTVLSPS